jgi:GAF domain-containing protein
MSTAKVDRDLEQLRLQQRAVVDVLRAVARSDGLTPVFEAIVEAATRICDAEFGSLYLAEGDLFRAAVGVYSGTGSKEQFEYEREHPHRRGRTTMVGRVAVTGELVHIPDVLADPDYSWEGQRLGGYRSLVGLPILVDEDLLGVLGVVRTVPEPFGDEQIELLRGFADQAAIGIANARLLETVERQLEQQRAISNVLAAVAREEGLESVLHALVEAAARLCDALFGEVWLIQGDLLRLAVGHGGPPELYEYERDHPHPAAGDHSTITGRVVLSHEVVQIPDILEDPEYSWPAAGEAGIRALLGAPLLVEGELVGVFNLVRTEPVPYTNEQIELVKTFADQAAIAIANARLLDAVERQKTELSRFVSPQVAELVSSDEGERMLAGHRAYISVCFCDLRGFTAFAETAAPEELLEVLREYHRTLGELISRHEGTLEHFAGDGVMVFFNDPVPVEQHELQAIRFALAAHESFAELAERWRKRGIELGLGIGISAGYATLGRIGFEGRYDYGALGSDTSLASRLSTEAKPGQILVSPRVYAAVEDEVEAELVGELELKGFGRPVVAHDVRGLR